MVFAKTSKSASRLSEQFKTDDVHKIYFAVVIGCPKVKKGHLVHYLKKDEKNNMVEIVPQSTEGAKRAELEYWVIDESDGYALVQIKLKTGRGHQIRTQLSYIKCPIYGDQKYGVRGKGKQIRLWAYKLTLEHPTKKEMMTFESKPPFYKF